MSLISRIRSVARALRPHGRLSHTPCGVRFLRPFPEVLEDRTLLTSSSSAINFAPTMATLDHSAAAVATGQFIPGGPVEIALANPSPASVTVYTASGHTDYPINLSGASPSDVATGDFNSDGKLDLVVANGASADLVILYGNGDGTFQAAQDLGFGQGATKLVTGPADNNSTTDLVTLNTTAHELKVYLGNGSGGFQLFSTLAGASTFVRLADLDHNGLADLVAANPSSNALETWYGNITGFSPGDSVALPDAPTSAVVSDLNGDGNADLAVTTTSSGNNVLLASGPSFVFYNGYHVPQATQQILLVDANGDGNPDLITVGRTSNGNTGVSVLLGHGDGAFPPAADDFTADKNANLLAVTDNAGSGFPNLLAIGGTHETLLTNTTATAAHLSISAGSQVEAGNGIYVYVTAFDASNQINPNYTGNITFSSSDGNASLPSAYTFSASDGGTKQFIVYPKTAGIQTVSITDDSGTPLTTRAGIIVRPTNVDHLTISAPSQPIKDSPFSFTVTAVDTLGNIKTDYAGTVQLSSSDPSAQWPQTSYTFITFLFGDNGVHTFSAKLETLGSQTITVTDQASSLSKTLNVVVLDPTTTTILEDDPNPSVNGESVFLNALVTAADSGLGNPTGTITFFDGSTAIAGPLTTVPVGSDSGQATISVSINGIADHSLTAVYSGDTKFGQSTSQVKAHTVTKYNTYVSVSSNSSVAAYGQALSFAAGVSPNYYPAPAPTGIVEFQVDGVSAITLALPTITNPNQSYNFVNFAPVQRLSLGTHTITVIYSGDSRNRPVTQSFTQKIASVTTDPHLQLISIADPSLVSDTANNLSTDPSVSSDGRFVAFESYATNLTNDVQNSGNLCVYIRDLQTGDVTVATVYPENRPSYGYSPTLTPDGRYVAYLDHPGNACFDS